eukprot:6186527-Pleurochrysis_carterae.AAC.3
MPTTAMLSSSTPVLCYGTVEATRCARHFSFSGQVADIHIETMMHTTHGSEPLSFYSICWPLHKPKEAPCRSARRAATFAKARHACRPPAVHMSSQVANRTDACFIRVIGSVRARRRTPGPSRSADARVPPLRATPLPHRSRPVCGQRRCFLWLAFQGNVCIERCVVPMGAPSLCAPAGARPEVRWRGRAHGARALPDGALQEGVHRLSRRGATARPQTERSSGCSAALSHTCTQAHAYGHARRRTGSLAGTSAKTFHLQLFTWSARTRFVGTARPFTRFRTVPRSCHVCRSWRLQVDAIGGTRFDDGAGGDNEVSCSTQRREQRSVWRWNSRARARASTTCLPFPLTRRGFWLLGALAATGAEKRGRSKGNRMGQRGRNAGRAG